jgi:hypothetical protein
MTKKTLKREKEDTRRTYVPMISHPKEPPILNLNLERLKEAQEHSQSKVVKAKG